MKGERVCTRRSDARHSFAACFRSGFSLLELLIVISIMFIVIALVMTGIRNYALRQSFQTTVIDVRDGIMGQRQNTIASVNDTLYGVYVSSTAVTLFDGPVFVEGDVDNVVFAIPNTTTFTSDLTDSTATITFARLTGIPSATGTLTLYDQTTSATVTITINETGLIE